MNESIRCEIIRDLLPSYADGLTSEASSQAVRAHLKTCPACRDILLRMTAPAETPPPAPVPQVDYLRQVKRKNRSRILLGIFLTIILALLLLLGKVFLLGQKTDPALVICETSVQGTEAQVRGGFLSSAAGFARCRWEETEPGVLRLTVYQCLISPFSQGDFQTTYSASAPITQLYLGDRLLWQDGLAISLLTCRLFEAKNPYLGDAPATLHLAELLNVRDQLGPYTNELHTAEEPYAWDIHLERTFSQEETLAAEKVMRESAYLFLALIGNLSQVNWIYSTPEEEVTLTVTQDSAGKDMAQEIKNFGESPAALETLLQQTGRNDYMDYSQLPNAQITIAVTNETEADLLYLELDLLINGNAVSTQGVTHADGSTFFPKECLVFDFLPSELGNTTPEETGFLLRLELKDGEEISFTMETLPLNSGDFAYSLRGNEETGFHLEAK